MSSIDGHSPSGLIRQRVVACVIAHGEHLLVCQRPAYKRHGGLWEFPGGKVESAETDRDAAARELVEELELELVRAGEAVFEVADEDSAFTIVFVPVEVRGEPVCLEHSGLIWARPAELAEWPLAPSDAAYVRFLLTMAEH